MEMAGGAASTDRLEANLRQALGVGLSCQIVEPAALARL
jgi:hypothetical protein